MDLVYKAAHHLPCVLSVFALILADGLQDDIEDAAPKQSNEHAVVSCLIFISGFINCLRLLLTQLLVGSCPAPTQSTMTDQTVTTTHVPLQLLRRVGVLAPSSSLQEEAVCYGWR
jgi:hypothetical protein